MSALNRFAGAGLKIGLTTISGIVAGSVKISPQLQKLIARYDGNQNPTLGATISNALTLEFTTRDITFATAPVLISSANTCVVYLRAFEDDGSMSSSYISLSIANGLLVPQTTGGTKGEAVVTSWVLHACSTDGLTNPVTVGSESLTQIAHGDAYTIGTLSLGNAIEQLTSMSINYNYQVDTNVTNNGLPYPTFANISQAEVTFEAETESISEATTDRINTGELVTSGIVMAFRKLAEGGIPTSGALTATLSKCIAEVTSLDHGSPATASITATAIEDTSYIVFSS